MPFLGTGSGRAETESGTSIEIVGREDSSDMEMVGMEGAEFEVVEFFVAGRKVGLSVTEIEGTERLVLLL